MKIGNVDIENDVFLAPIAGFSDVGFRAICAEQGAGLTYTEMASAKGLYYQHSEKTKELLYTTDVEKIKAAQIFGSEPFYISYAVNHEYLSKFNIIDINMGCPVPKIVKNKEGSALMTNIPLAQEIVKTAKQFSKVPITIKMRLGFNDIIAVDFAKAMEDAGVDAITVHGRTRAEMYGGHSHWDEIKKVVKAVSIPVIANGDVCSIEDYIEIKEQTQAQGVMIARGALGNPNLFAKITGKEEKPLKELILKHMSIMLQFHNERYVHSNFKKHIACYFKGVRGNRELKQKAFESKNIDEMRKIIEDSNI